MMEKPEVKILVVEDEKIVAIELLDRLRVMGYGVTATVASGEEAISEAERERPDLVLMDIQLKGKMDGIAIRVPTPNVSLVDLVVIVEKPATKEAVNAALKQAAAGPLKGILQFCEEELVSIDFRGNPNSAIVDAGFTKVVGEDLVKVLAWYDNEWGYSCRVRDLVRYIGR